jgi:hypothetical protein
VRLANKHFGTVSFGDGNGVVGAVVRDNVHAVQTAGIFHAGEIAKQVADNALLVVGRYKHRKPFNRGMFGNGSEASQISQRNQYRIEKHQKEAVPEVNQESDKSRFQNLQTLQLNALRMLD